MTISKKMRFDVFKRDNFTCGYCGGTPPKVILEVDHILARKNGGEDRIDNLISSCFDCNRGKSSQRLDVIPPSLSQKIRIMDEKRAQLRAYENSLKKMRRQEDIWIDEVCGCFEFNFENRTLSPKFKNVSVRRFVQLLAPSEVMQAMNIACSRKPHDMEEAIKYFCGICWRLIKGTLYA